MAGRGRVGHPIGLRGPPQGMLRPGLVGHQPGLVPTPVLIEHKLNSQHHEIQRLAAENQRLAATHVALRQELALAQQEVQRLQQALGGIQAEKEAQIRNLLDTQSKMEADLQGLETLKAELHQARADATKLNALRQDLSGQIQALTQDLQRARSEVQQIPSLQIENDNLRQELQRARTAFDYEKKAISEQVEQRQAMEKNLVSMAREVEKLRAELTNAEKRARLAGNPGGGYSSAEVGLSGLSKYRDGYGLHEMAVGVDNGAPYGAGPASTWGSYDVPRGGLSHARR
ncbi:hypothetical protein O6H91_19G078600 [Diphasiastrum complanatum]|uniref:Uncharacterized protein n=1 Tax=Diphasiastrum complanatum TaxID=34168 RepID=A0ACC2AWV2_DIPCM|nr:hypothetical protein O6H91_19G078600 [Diphasiastrum complanatum]